MCIRDSGTKAMETKGLLPFCRRLLQIHAAQIGCPLVDQLCGVGDSMLSYIGRLREAPRAVPAVQLQRMFDAMARLLRLWLSADLPRRPKLHVLMHLVSRTAFQGKPAYYATWMGETLSRTLATLGRQAHRLVWELRILVHFERIEDARATPKKRRLERKP